MLSRNQASHKGMVIFSDVIAELELGNKSWILSLFD